jgi:DNA recombination protein RmuC
MEYVAIALAAIAAVIAVAFAVRPKQDSNGLVAFQQQIDGLRDQIRKSLESSQKSLSDGLENATTAVREVTGRLSKMEESTKRIFDVGKSIAELQDILKAPKLRGGLGELFLEDLLRQILPPAHFETQYKFSTGEVVDSVIRVGDNLVPVDAKFPLENFKRLFETSDEAEQKKHRKQLSTDMKKHIDNIADKYIKPDENTFDFAMMYIPAENIYYEAIIEDDRFGGDKSILAYALTKKVIPVSPNSFYAYLQAILLGLRGLHVEKSAQEVIASLGAMRGDLARFQGDFDKLGSHLNHADGSYTSAQKRLQKFAGRLEGAETATGLPRPDTANESKQFEDPVQ